MVASEAFPAVPSNLNMGIWWSDGEKLWLPKYFFPTRNDAKRFAVTECYSDWIDIRVRTVWAKEVPDGFWPGESSYLRAEKNDDGAFECWEVNT